MRRVLGPWWPLTLGIAALLAGITVGFIADKVPTIVFATVLLAYLAWTSYRAWRTGREVQRQLDALRRMGHGPTDGA